MLRSLVDKIQATHAQKSLCRIITPDPSTIGDDITVKRDSAGIDRQGPYPLATTKRETDLLKTVKLESPAQILYVEKRVLPPGMGMKRKNGISPDRHEYGPES